MNEDLLLTCRREIERLLAQHDWRLLADREQCAALVAAEVAAFSVRVGQPLDTSTAIRRSILARYGVELYEACGSKTPARRNRAFDELWAYLHPFLRHSLRDESRAADATQGALVKIWERRAQCREPRSFLRWAQMIALNESKSLLRVERAEAEPEADLTLERTGDEPVLGLSAAPIEDGASPRLDDSERRAQIRRAIQHCIAGSDLQQRVIIELFLNEHDIHEVAALLRVSDANVSVLKTRALKTLRGCAEFIEALEDWLDISTLAAGS